MCGGIPSTTGLGGGPDPCLFAKMNITRLNNGVFFHYFQDKCIFQPGEREIPEDTRTLLILVFIDERTRTASNAILSCGGVLECVWCLVSLVDAAHRERGTEDSAVLDAMSGGKGLLKVYQSYDRGHQHCCILSEEVLIRRNDDGHQCYTQASDGFISIAGLVVVGSCVDTRSDCTKY